MSSYNPSEKEAKYKQFYESFVNRFFPSKSKSECQRLANVKWKEIRNDKDFEIKFAQVLTENKLQKPPTRLLQLLCKTKPSSSISANFSLQGIIAIT